MEDDELKKIIESSKIENKGFFDRLRNRDINKKKKQIQEELKNLELAKLDYLKSKLEDTIKFYEETARLNRINIIKKSAKDCEEE